MSGRGQITVMVLIVVSVLCGSCTTRRMLEPDAIRSTPLIAGEQGLTGQDRAEAVIKEVAKDAPDAAAFHKLLLKVAALSDVPLFKDSRAELLIDGPMTYQAMLGAIERAKRFIYLETFIFSDNQIGRQFADALTHKALEGVEFYLIYDSIGSADSDPEFFESMKKTGIRILEYHKANPLDGGNLMNVNERDHPKLMVLDGTVAFTGGIWSTVGSSNLDYRSFLHNDEINAVVFGKGFALQMEGQFMADLKEADPITLEQWKQRPFKDRLKEVFSRLFQFWI
ncbi:MAG: phospholipase D-like domain-containing protein [Lysobacterales bacterium]